MDIFNHIVVYVSNKLKHKNYDRIIDNLYLGNFIASKTDTISSERINTIINCSKNLPFYSDITTNYRVDINDDISFHSNIQMFKTFHEIIPIIHNNIIQNKTVLVHCYAGMQRSAAIVAAYLIKYKNMSYEDAVQFIRKKRKVSFLTGSNFNIALLLFEKQVHEHSKLNNNNH